VVHTDQDEVVKLVTQERWTKTRTIVRGIAEELERAGKGRLMDRARLGSHRGFLVYVARTYSQLVPYLKGIHATMEAWRPDRDEDGWKIHDFAFDFDQEEGEEERKRVPPAGTRRGLTHKDGPKKVRAVPRLNGDLEALLAMTESETPPRCVVRSQGVVTVTYGFGDASGLGFGSSIDIDGETIRVRTGTWPWTISEEASSNWRELKNLVEAIKDMALEGRLEGKELFMFTDNSVAERAYFKGTSKSRRLFELVLELRKLEMMGTFKLHLIHVAGTRMIESGIDGLSRGDFNTGVMTGRSILDYVPLAFSAVERSPEVVEWIKSWVPEDLEARFLKPDEWMSPFEKGKCYVWSPPPAAADFAVELLAEGIHKRPHSYHIVVVPRLMTYRWHKVLGKTSDFTCQVPARVEGVWDRSQHEPLTLAVVFPLSECKPWRIKEFPEVREGEAHLRRVLKTDWESAGSCLRELLGRARELGSLSPGMVRDMLPSA